MNPVAFIDANVPIYAAGREHPYKQPCAKILLMMAETPAPFITDSEVLQELLHYYLASGRWSLGQEVFRAFSEAMQGRIEPVHAEDILSAANSADNYPRVSSRDLVHVAVMRRLGVNRVISADTDFDYLPGIERLDPAGIGDWGSAILTVEER